MLFAAFEGPSKSAERKAYPTTTEVGAEAEDDNCLLILDVELLNEQLSDLGLADVGALRVEHVQNLDEEESAYNGVKTPRVSHHHPRLTSSAGKKAHIGRRHPKPRPEGRTHHLLAVQQTVCQELAGAELWRIRSIKAGGDTVSKTAGPKWVGKDGRPEDPPNA